jgi:WD40 repeat protein
MQFWPTLPGIFAVFAVCTAISAAEPDLAVQLAEQSKRVGLGVITTMPSNGHFPIRYFDNTWGQVHCCGRLSQTWVATGGRLLVSVDSSNFLLRSGDPQSWGRNVILVDLNGNERRRFSSWLHPDSVAVSPDGKMIAFRGQGGLPPGSTPPPQSGLLLGPIDGTSFVKVHSVPSGNRFFVSRDERAETFAWSPDADALVYSRDGTIYIYDLAQSTSRSIAKGSNPQWSPDGATISYRGPNREAMLVDVAGKKPRRILEGQRIHHALRWSPDGRYLLLSLFTEERGVRFCQECVYRTKDGAVLKIGEKGLGDDAGDDWVLAGPR